MNIKILLMNNINLKNLEGFLGMLCNVIKFVFDIIVFIINFVKYSTNIITKNNEIITIFLMKILSLLYCYGFDLCR